QQPRGDRSCALRLDRHLAIGTVLRSELHIKEAQKVVDLRECCPRALAPAAARALLDGHRGRDSEDRIDVGPRRGLYELSGVGVERLEIASLTLIEEDVKGEGRLTRS